MKKNSLRATIALLLCITIPVGVNATTIDDIKKQQKETQKALDEAKGCRGYQRHENKGLHP